VSATGQKRKFLASLSNVCYGPKSGRPFAIAANAGFPPSEAIATSDQSQSLTYAAIIDCLLRFRAKVSTKPMQGYVTILNEPLELHCHHENISDLRKARRMDWTTTHLGDFSDCRSVQLPLVQTYN
jgi:hypothetical protein